MRPASSAFLAAVTGSHTMLARARVVAPGQSGTDPDGDEIGIIDGDVVYDATADVRATLDLTTPGYGWDPRVGRSLIQPYGSEIFVERGIQIVTGATEWVSQGYYRIYEVGQDQAPHGDLRIAGRDRMSAIVDARLTAPRQFGASTLASDVVTQLVTEVLPDAQVDYLADDGPIGRQLVAEQDRYAFLRDLADSRGARIYWDYRGHLVISPVPDPDMPVWTVAGGEGGVLVSVSRSISRDGVYNGVVATAEGADTQTPARALAVDNNPDSPTYWRGTYGQVPGFYSSPLISSSSQAASAARAMLQRTLGLPYAVDMSAVPNPALEDSDVITVAYPGVSETHILDRLTIPLTAQAAMTGTTRHSQAIAIEVS